MIAHLTGISGRFPSIAVQEVQPFVLYQTLFIPKLVNTATNTWSDDPVFMQFRKPFGNVAPVMSVTFALIVAAATVFALSSLNNFPVLPPIKTLLGVYGETLNDEALLLTPFFISPATLNTVLVVEVLALSQRRICVFGVPLTPLLAYMIFCASS